MEFSQHSEQEFIEYPDKLPEGLILTYLKLVGIGDNTLNSVNHDGVALCDKISGQQGFFLFCPNTSDIRELLHQIVDRFCDAQEERNEPKS